ncbi:MAG: calcium-binding protein, partial [Hyphomicrobiales bacterium]
SFQFVQADFGTITIADFEDGSEKLDFSSILNPLYAASNLDIQQIGADVQIRFVDPTTHVALPDTVLLQGESAASITGDDMVFRNVITTIVGTAGNDHLVGGAGVDLMQGLAGDDILDGAAGSDTLDGGAGNDTALFAVSSDATVDLVTGLAHIGADIDTLIGIENVSTGAGNDQITGSAGDNVLSGGAGDDTLLGGDGNDTLVGGSGVNVLNGGNGFDAVSYADYGRGVSVLLSTGSLIGSAELLTPDAAFTFSDALSSVERVTGSEFDDTLRAGNLGNTLMGGSGNDLLIGGFGSDVLVGGAGVDSLVGNAGNDLFIIDTNGLSESIQDVANVDILDPGNIDAVRIVDAIDMSGLPVSYTLAANLENLDYTGMGNFTGSGNGRANTITGSNGNDILDGDPGVGDLDAVLGRGADNINGGSGDDILKGHGQLSNFDGGDGFDIISYAGSSVPYDIDLALGQANNTNRNSSDPFDVPYIDYLTSVEGVLGGEAGDIITGNSGPNRLYGNGGNDVIKGGAGNDILVGGAGNDVFMFGPGGGSNDVIQDFHSINLNEDANQEFDVIDLTAYGQGLVFSMTADASGFSTLVTVTGAGFTD